MSPRSKCNEEKISRRKLIDRLLPAPEYGPLLGILATTYEFKPEFFETDFLPTVLGLGAWDDRNWTSRVAVEKALAELEGAVVFADARRYQGRPRSLRVDVMAVALPAGAALHAKILLLVHRDAVRFHVASANLTDEGYRRNREVAAPLVVTCKQPEHAALISAALQGIRGALGPWWTETAERVVSTAMRILARWPTARGGEYFLWGTEATSPWERLLDAWPGYDIVERVTIVSPFWAEERDDAGPLRQLLARLRDRGALMPDATVRLLTEAKHLGGEKYQPVLPESYTTFDARRLKVVANAEAVDPRILPEEVDSQEGLLMLRPLHAKVLLLEGRGTSIAYMGSANFSNRAWGLSGVPQNIEAGLILRREGEARDALASLIPKTVGAPVPLAGAAKGQVALPVEDDDPKKPWPTFLREVCLAPDPVHSERLLLEVRVDPATVHGAWSVALAGEGAWEEAMLLDTGASEESEYCVDLSPARLEQLLRDQEVRVRWWMPGGGINVPINVSPSARDALPIVHGAAKPGESLLLAYYQGRISFEELFPDPDGATDGDAAGSVAESSSIDTSRIQSYQVREFVEALKGIRDDLKQVAKATPRAMRLALHGPVSPVALARAVAGEVEARRRSATAGAFQFFEILCCLLEARTFQVGEHAVTWQAEIRQAAESIERLLNQLRTSYPEALAQSFSRYERQLRAHYRDWAEAQ